MGSEMCIRDSRGYTVIFVGVGREVGGGCLVDVLLPTDGRLMSSTRRDVREWAQVSMNPILQATRVDFLTAGLEFLV